MVDTPKRLFIPGKTDPDAHQPGYGQDMRTLEMFNPINKLVAGSGVTLTPSNGEGPQVEISAAGGGGDVPAAFFCLGAAPDSNSWAAGVWYPFGPQIVPNSPSVINAITTVGLFSNPSSNVFETDGNVPMLASSWFVIVNGGDSVNIFPFLETPLFTGGTGVLTITYMFWAVSSDFANGVLYRGTTDVPSFTSVQPTSSDLQLFLAFGSDLVLTPGTGNSQNGLVSTAGSIPYFAGVNAQVYIPPGTSF